MQPLSTTRFLPPVLPKTETALWINILIEIQFVDARRALSPSNAVWDTRDSLPEASRGVTKNRPNRGQGVRDVLSYITHVRHGVRNLVRSWTAHLPPLGPSAVGRTISFGQQALSPNRLMLRSKLCSPLRLLCSPLCLMAAWQRKSLKPPSGQSWRSKSHSGGPRES